MKEIKIGTFTKSGDFSQHRVTHKPRQQEHKHQNHTPRRIERIQKEKGKNGKKKMSLGKIVLWIIILSVLVFVGFASYRWYSLQTRVNGGSNGSNLNTKCTNLLDPDCWTEAFRPQLKQDEGFTNMLIVGLDTRDSGKGSSLMNTDSIMVASLNHETNQVMLISIPRDFYVTFKITNKETGKQAGPYSMKITSVYATGEARDDVDNGMELLEEVVEGIIGQPIQYRTVVKFKAVEDVVNAFGGVTINVEDEFAAKYPVENNTPTGADDWKRYDFAEGENQLDGEKALVYARFRSVYNEKDDGHLASDFSRGERQQEIIDAIKEKALSEDLSTKDKAQKYWEIIQTLQKHIETQVTFEDILAGLSLLDEIDREPLNVVLDPNFGGSAKLIFVDQSNYAATGYIISPRDKTYKGIQNELAKVWEYGHLYEEQAHIYIANKSGKAPVKGDKAFELKNSEAPLGEITYQTVAKTDKTGISIYDFSGGKYPETIKFLEEYFGVKVTTDPAAVGVSQSGFKEDIQVIVGLPEPSVTPPTTTAP